VTLTKFLPYSKPSSLAQSYQKGESIPAIIAALKQCKKVPVKICLNNLKPRTRYQLVQGHRVPNYNKHYQQHEAEFEILEFPPPTELMAQRCA